MASDLHRYLSPHPHDVTYELLPGGGWLVVGGGLALSTAEAFLGCAVGFVSGPLSRVERGIVEGLLATAFAQLGLPPVVLRWSAALPQANDCLVLEILAKSPLCGGRAWLCGTPEFIERMWMEVSDGLHEPHSVALCLARTLVPEEEWLALASDDVVAFDETPSFVPGRSVVEMEVASVRVPARITVGGTLSVETDLVANRGRQAIPSAGTIGVAALLPQPHGSHWLRRLVAGETIAVDWHRPVVLEAGGTACAEGSIVDAGGNLGIRIRRRLAG